MNILLINSNPVVSRLFSLCTHDACMNLEETDNAGDIAGTEYEVVFIDEGSYEGGVLRLNEKIKTGKKILLSNTDVLISDFDMTIQKPFLPSQIIEVLEEVKASKNAEDIENEREEEQESAEVQTAIFPLSSDDSEDEETGMEQHDEARQSNAVLDAKEVAKIKELLEADEDEPQEASWSDEAYEKRKIEVIKEQLIAEGLEIVEENEIVDTLNEKGDEAADMVIFDAAEEDAEEEKEKKDSAPDKDEKKKMKSLKHKSKKEKKKKKINFTQEERAKIQKAIEGAISTLKRKQKKKLLKGKKVDISIALEDV